MSEDDAKKVRKANFQANEIAILVEEVGLHQTALFGPFSATLTAKVKGKLWQGIAEKINAVCGTNRGAVEIRKKWNDYKCYVKRRSMSLKKELKMTGGGTAPPGLTVIEEKVLSMIPTCQIDGVEGGVEIGFSEEVPLSTVSQVTSDTWEYTPPSATTTTAMLCEASTAEVVIVTEAKAKTTKGKRKLEMKDDDEINRLADIEMKKVKLLQDMTDIWREYLSCTKAYQKRDLEIKENLLEIKQKEKLGLDYSVDPEIKFLNEL